MADRLDADPGAVACVGDILEFGDSELVRAVPAVARPLPGRLHERVPHLGALPADALEEIGGWYRDRTAHQGYEDWNLWMGLAERRSRILHLGPGVIGYRRRLHGSRLNAEAKRRHAEIYRVMREDHPELFGALAEHRRRSDLSLRASCCIRWSTARAPRSRSSARSSPGSTGSGSGRSCAASRPLVHRDEPGAKAGRQHLEVHFTSSRHAISSTATSVTTYARHASGSETTSESPAHPGAEDHRHRAGRRDRETPRT